MMSLSSYWKSLSVSITPSSSLGKHTLELRVDQFSRQYFIHIAIAAGSVHHPIGTSKQFIANANRCSLLKLKRLHTALAGTSKKKKQEGTLI